MGIYEGAKYIEVHPTFLYESIATFLIFIILTILSNKRKFKGQITLVYLITYSFARMIIEGLRTDSLMLGNIRISQLLSLIIFVISIIVYIKKNNKNWNLFNWCGKCDVGGVGAGPVSAQTVIKGQTQGLPLQTQK